MAKTGKYWRKHEKQIMKALGFAPVPGSGSGWVCKEDGESESAIVQLKSTEKDSFKFNLLDMKKLEYHAGLSDKLPMFIIEFLNRETYVVLNVCDFDRLRDISLGGELEAKTHSPLRITSVDTSIDTREQESPQAPPKRVSSSKSDRNKFYKEREQQWKKSKIKK